MSTSQYDKTNPRQVASRFDTLKNVLHSLHVSKAESLCDEEIARCMDGRVAEAGLIKGARKLRDCGELSMHMVETWYVNGNSPEESTVPSELAQQFVNSGMPSLYAVYAERRLIELATVLTKLSELQSNDADGWTDAHVSIKESIREQVRGLVEDIPGVKEVEFGSDPRGYALKLALESGRHNSMSGTWGVAVDENLFDVLDTDDLSKHVWIGETKAVELTPSENAALGVFLRQWPADTNYEDIIDLILNSEENDELEEVGIEVEREYDHLHGGRLANAIRNAFEANTRLISNVLNEVKENLELSVFVLTIENTGNAAFVDAGRHYEVARIMRDVAGKVEAFDRSTVVRDLNGNKVGEFKMVAESPTDGVRQGAIRIVIDSVDSKSIDYEDLITLLRDGATRVENGDLKFSARDGDVRLRFEWVPEPDLSNDSGIDMKAALKSGAVYMADGIEDGEYRFVVVTNDFEPGYGQGAGDAWLVNAKGECASGYEDPTTVREVHLRHLDRDELSQLREVVEGKLSFEDYERQFGSDDVEPD